MIIREVFVQNGSVFASQTVQVAGGDQSSATAAATTIKTAVDQKKLIEGGDVI